MARLATKADVIKVVYEQIDAARRKIGVAPLRLGKADDGSARLKVSVMPGEAAKVPASMTLKLGRDEVEFELVASEDYLGARASES